MTKFVSVKLSVLKNNKNRPIGIFDSGIGGLTVADSIHRLLPNEQLIYFGDTAHLPYGDKSPSSIKSYGRKIAEFLLQNDCKMIVIACNTASAIAFDEVNEFVAKRAMVVDVINPVVKAVCSLKKSNHVGIIGTRATIRSKAYYNKLKALKPGIKVSSQATPLLAPMIEEGFFNNKISTTIINSYLSQPKLKGIDTLVLACTHYPLIKNEISAFYTSPVRIVDSAEIVAKYVKKKLGTAGLLGNTKKSNHKFYVTDFTKSFEKSTSVFFKGRIKLSHSTLWSKNN